MSCSGRIISVNGALSWHGAKIAVTKANMQSAIFIRLPLGQIITNRVIPSVPVHSALERQPISFLQALGSLNFAQYVCIWRTTPVISFNSRIKVSLLAEFTPILLMRSLTVLPSTSSPLLWVAAIVSALGIVAVGVRALESAESKAKRLERKRQKEIRALTQRISAYARGVHRQFPTADVVVSEGDLAEQLRKRTDMVVTALNLLLNEQKVQRAPLSGYWKLNA
jgi:hypothetical protein